MALKFFIFICLVIIIRAKASVPVAAPIISDSTYDPNPQYYFGYDVQDALTGDSKSQVETRNGNVVLGQYSLNDPDGTRRIVDYSSDSINGFNAVVRKAPLAVATPVVAAAALTPVLEPSAVRAVATPLVETRSAILSSPAAVRTVSSPAAVRTVASPAVEPRSAPTLQAERRSGGVAQPAQLAPSASLLRSAARPQPSAPTASPPSQLSRAASPASSQPTQYSNPPFPISSAIFLRAINPISSTAPSSSASQSSADPQVRSAPASSPVAQPAPGPVQSRQSSQSDSVEIKSATLEAESGGQAAGGWTASQVAAAPGVPAAPLAYAAAPAFAYGGYFAPVAYNVW